VVHGHKVDVAQFPVGFLQIVQPVRHFGTAENVATFDWKKATQQIGIAYRFVVLECNLSQTVQRSLFDDNQAISPSTN
jgi:hypothetical protein